MFDKKRLIDIGLVVIILAICVLVYFQIRRTVSDLSGRFQETDTPEDTVALEEPTPSVTSNENQSATLAPDFELANLEGDNIALSDYHGTPVMINFWAIWCPPCRDELPLIQSFADQHEDKLVVLAVNAGEDRTNVVHFVNEFNYDLVFLLDPANSVSAKYGVRGLPTSVFINEDGLIQAIHVGLLNEPLISDYLSQVGVVE